MPKTVHPHFPEGDSCKVCGSQMIIHSNRVSYKSATCPKCGFHIWIEADKPYRQ